MRKIYPLTGGVHPLENKSQSLQLGIGELPMPTEVVVPMQQHIGAPAKPIVAVGDKVLKGQMIAEAGGFVSAAAHAPTSGTVTAIDFHSVAHPSGMPQPCITIKSDGQDQWIAHQGIENYLQAEPSILLGKIREAGIAGMGGAGFPSAVKLGPSKPIDTLIINGTECEPYITADDILMQTHPEEIIEGIKLLAHILGQPETILIGIEDNKPKAYEALQPHLEGTGIELAEFPTRYPSGGEKQLIQILTGKEVPNGGLPMDLGIVCQNIGTCRAIYRAISHGEPLISRVTTVVGEACQTQRNYYTLIGTPVSHVLENSGFQPEKCSRLVMGGPMMGFTLEDTSVPVIKTTNCLLAATPKELPAPPPAQACIRCGLCAEACPVSLLPQQLYWHAQSQNHEKLEAHNLFDCIECGACSFVCPSSIPLVQYYRAAKGEIIQHRKDVVKSDRARQRFEVQQSRKDRIEAEKKAKKEERRKAAALAKEKAGTNTGKADDLVQAAMARVAEKKAAESPEQQRSKMERLLKSAENRLEVAEGKLQELIQSGTPEQLEQAKARVEASRLKLDGARSKLAEQPAIGNETTPSAPDKPTLTPEQQSSKMERLAASAEKRLKVAEDKLLALDESATSDEKKQAQTKIDAARLKLEEARNNLSQLSETTVEATAISSPSAPQKPELTPEQQASKLERLKASAEKRLKVAEDKLQKLTGNGTAEELEQAKNKVEAARLKFEDAKNNLTELSSLIGSKLEEPSKPAEQTPAQGE